jgi:hypothetical protein
MQSYRMKPFIVLAAAVLAALAPALPLAAQAPALTGGAEPRDVRAPAGSLQAVRADEPVVVDGVLSEAAWSRAQPMEIAYEFYPGDNVAPPVRTECRAGYDDENLYLGCTAFDPEPGRIRAHLSDRDKPFTDDHLTFMIDPFNDQRRAFEFRVTPLGVQMDAMFIPQEGFEDFSWDALWRSAGRITPDGYVVELAIPFKSLRFPQTAGPQSWRIVLERSYPRSVRHRMRSALISRNDNCLLCGANPLEGLQGIAPGRDLEVAPTLTAHRTDARDAAAGRLVSGDGQADVGLTARWGVTSNATLAATLNPDFSQVEADVAQLEVNERFALSYPERRPFFLEGAEVFGTPLPMVFTRTVVDPAAGAKLTGKQGGGAYGVMGAQDQVNTLVFPANQASSTALLQQEVSTGVARYRRDVGGSSSLGVLVTTREADGYHNRTAGLDGLVRLGRSTQVRFQGALSDTDYPDTLATRMAQRTGAFGGVNAYAQFSHLTRNWTATATARNVERGFRADAGFIPRVDLRGVNVDATRIRWGRPGGWYSRLALSAQAERFTNQDGRLTDQAAAVIGNYQGPRQSVLNLGVGHSRRLYNGQMFEMVDARWILEMRPSRAIGFRMLGRYGDDVDVANTRRATLLSLQPTVDARVGRHLNLTLSHSLRTLTLGGEEILEAGLTQAQVGYHFSARTMVRAILQYQDIDRNPALHVAPVKRESESFFSQFLFSYRLNPQTLLFLGYSDNHLGEDGATVVRTGRTLFLKLGYAWQL